MATDESPERTYSVIIPVYNEQENLHELYHQLHEAARELDGPVELIFVDDGSSDGSFDILWDLSQRDPDVKVVRFRRNFGQTAALSAGIDHSTGAVLIAIDADLQNDPADIPRLVAKLDEGYDVVSGWRKRRHDPMLRRRLPSRMANALISSVTGVHLHDYGCTLKVYRRDVLADAVLYGEMHRFIPVYATWAGARVAELVVNHRPRVAGKSKYGMSRVFKVFLDLITIKFLSSYATKPTYFFGRLGLLFCLAGSAVGILVLYQKFFRDVYVHRNPLLLLAVFVFLLGIQLIMMGVLAEIEIRTYFESQRKRPYLVRETINCDTPDA